MEALDDFYTYHPFVYWYMTTQVEGHSQHFSNRIGFLHLMIVNFENAASHKYVVQHAKSLWLAKLGRTEHSVLVLIQKWHKLFYENSSCKLLSYHPGDGRCVASLNFNCVWFVDPTFRKLKSNVLLKLCIKLNFCLKLLSVLSEQLA